MKQPIVENGVVVGTGSDKFEQKNPIVQWALRGFDRAILELAVGPNPQRILEVGCGEGHVTNLLLQSTQARIVAYDISRRVLDVARQTVSSDRVEFGLKNILDLDPERDRAPLIVCCEVLEHLECPEDGLRRLAEVADPYAVLSVPREPLFRTLNFLRGSHVRSFGNSPGHLQHWSARAFLRFVRRHFDILEVRTPVPWTAVLARSRMASIR
jgi:2-polyprenyl-3-methyl-5-hydroxy-6-metoxy-1,4-benzoquinol methylase